MNSKDYQGMFYISSHWLISCLISPAECWRKYLDPNRPVQETTDAMRFGTLVHCLMLTPKMFEQEFLVADFERKSMIGKTHYTELLATGKIIVKPGEIKKAKTIITALKANSEARKLLTAGSKEITLVKPREIGLLPLKARLDVLNKKNKMVVEFKTTYSLRAIETAIERYRYLLSASFYMHLSKSTCFKFVFVQTSEPYEIAILDVSKEQLQNGKEQWQAALKKFDDCWKTNYWPEAEITPKVDSENDTVYYTPRKYYDIPVGEIRI